MAVYAAIPTFNRRETLRECIAALSQQSVRPIVVVAASGSTDGTIDMLATSPLETIICRGKSDQWWTGATNLALREILRRCANDDWILCLNDDTNPRPDSIERLLAAAAKSPNRIVGSVVVDARNPDQIVDGGNWMNMVTAKMRALNRGRRLSEFSSDYEQRVNLLTGRGTLYPAGAFRELGLFNELLPHYGADYEFALRCHSAGYELVINYDSIMSCRTDLSGVRSPRHRFRPGDAYDYFFSRRSTCNLKDRFRFARLTHRQFAVAMLFYLMSVARIVKNYFIPSVA